MSGATYSTFALAGGLDLSSAALAVPAGRLVAALNYEPLAEGYGRVAGYERFDGRVPASKIPCWTLPFENGGIPFTQGQHITGATSGATAKIILEPYGVAGDWDLSTATGTLVLGFLAGVFADGELLRVGGTPHAAAAGIAVQDSAPTPALHDEWTIAAREEQRAAIGKVPGFGPVRGVAVLNGTVYAWRNDAGETKAVLHRSTATGWQPVQVTRRLAFHGNTHEIAEGDAIVQGTAGGTVARVVVSSGTFEAGTAVGYLVLTGQVNAFSAGTFYDDAAVAIGTLSGDSSAVLFPPGGRYDTIGHNFYGAANRYRLYGANGVGPAFEFDGSVVAPISTGMVDDRPTRVAEIAQHLVLTFPGGSIQFSGDGEPFEWQPLLGAGEFGIGAEVTDVVQAAETAVVIFGRNKVVTLSGRDVDTFQLDEVSEEAGAEPWTAQRVGTTIYLDKRGLRTLSATAAYGNFKTGTLTEAIAPYFRDKWAAGAAPVLSLVCKSKTHYRLFWDDGTGLSVYLGRKVAEAIPFSLGDMRPFCGTVAEMGDGTEAMLVGGEDGYVYRLDSGPSFDGEAVQGFAMLPYNHLGGVMVNKRFQKVSCELVAQPTSRIGLSAQFDYGDGVQPSDTGKQFLVNGGGGVWDVSTWGEFYWSAAFEGTAEAHIDGFGRNISVLIAAQSGVLEDPHVLQACTIHYSPRGMKR